MANCGGTAYHIKGSNSKVSEHDTNWLEILSKQVGRQEARRCYNCYFRRQQYCALAKLPLADVNFNRCDAEGDPGIDTDDLEAVKRWRELVRVDLPAAGGEGE